MTSTSKPPRIHKGHKIHTGLGQLRIIGGEWRSRRLSFPDAPGLRPTPDRVRETLFNWLAPYIEGARVLDPFAGSGALYLEALSRGASMGLALDTNSMAISSLREHLGTLRCTVGKTATGDALRHLETQPAEQFDVVFLDPPFHQDLLMPACTLLEDRNWLADNAWIYTESETAPSGLGMPANWRLHREKKAGQVHYALWERSVAAS
ncbi:MULTISPECIES: 16S rRNA (guanine(966)-N(2))-methyltransferase RsmD [Pseudomonas]|uniref:Ribosomal RNA small subunit methyltransferase D n=1 Tax=Pseudomonas lutea TaxID=243924 RepID=A0ABR9A8X4_9PSED|nr:MULTISPECIES: 16S rRNA (guanine(966)-N(2))-methyltransferase RsmD [Pseudomonas]MBD8122471.1 16S rRNA (guanine(966)-N(2))-methyltransferase RsmD [Pseudomonas lutea]